MTERFTRWSDDQILYQFTVEDPTLYKQAWGGEMSLNVSNEPLYEYACHEGNYALAGILAGARKLEREGRPHPVGKADLRRRRRVGRRISRALCDWDLIHYAMPHFYVFVASSLVLIAMVAWTLAGLFVLYG